MPAPEIHTGTWALGKELQIIEAVQQAVQTALQTPTYDRDVTLNIYDDKHRIRPSNLSDWYTRINILMFAGRSKGTKLRLYQDVTNALAPFGVPAEHVHVVLIETPLENWGIRGAQAASDVNLGFKVHI